ncbi:MAG: KAP family P-loop NTPase fold protein [Methyloligella sp. ZOD6]
MRLFPPPIEIGDEEGFTAEKDIFGRARIGAGLTHLLSAASDPIVVGVDGQWGSGKTIFLKMWAGELRKAGYPVVYFDAFENDYLEDAFLALASQIINLAQDKKKQATPKGRKFINSAVKAGKILMRSGVKVGVKGATAGLVSVIDLEEIASDIASEASSLADKHVGQLLTKQKQQKDAIQGFRDALSELPSLLSERPKSNDKQQTPKPLIFIIDELDRCRPSFALELLERIKHFFSVENVHFVLGVHLGQLTNSVVIAYGPNIDARTYLQKFIQLTLPLVDRQRLKHEKTPAKYLEYLRSSMEFKHEDRNIVDHSIELILHVEEHIDLSLRSIERIMSNLVIALAYTPRNTLRVPPIIAGLCILKVTEPHLFNLAKQGRLTYPQVRDALIIDGKTENRAIRDWLARWWKFCTNEPTEGAEDLAKSLWQYNIEATEIIPHTAHAVIDRLQPNL